MLNLRPAASRLRTDMFATREREETTSISVAYTHTIADSRIDAAAVDCIDATKAYFGCSFHYVVMIDGTVEIGRDPKTLSSRGRSAAWRHSTIYVGVVGGLHFDTGQRLDTITDAQREALANLEQAIANILQKSLDVIDHTIDWLGRAKIDAAEEEQERNLEDQLDHTEQTTA